MTLVRPGTTLQLPKSGPRTISLGHELSQTTVEAPRAVGVVEDVVVPTHQLDRPTLLAFQEEDHVAARPSLVVIPVGDQRVDDQVSLGSHRLPLGVRLAEGVV